MQFFLGLPVSALGILMILKAESFLRTFGPMGWAEKHLGPGQSKFGYQLIGGVITFIGFTMVFGLYNSFIGWILSPLIKTVG